MKRVQWTDQASADIVEVLEYYETIDRTLAPALRRRIVAATGPLVDRPGIGSPTDRFGIRKWRVRGTPFLLLYRVLTGGTVEILRIHHAARDWHPE